MNTFLSDYLCSISDSDVDSGIAQAYNHDTNGRKDSTSSSSNGIATSSNDIASSSNDIASSSNDIEQEREGKTDAAPRWVGEQKLL